MWHSLARHTPDKWPLAPESGGQADLDPGVSSQMKPSLEAAAIMLAASLSAGGCVPKRLLPRQTFMCRHGHKLLVEVTAAAAASNPRVYLLIQAWSKDDAETAAVSR